MGVLSLFLFDAPTEGVAHKNFVLWVLVLAHTIFGLYFEV